MCLVGDGVTIKAEKHNLVKFTFGRQCNNSLFDKDELYIHFLQQMQKTIFERTVSFLTKFPTFPITTLCFMSVSIEQKLPKTQ